MNRAILVFSAAVLLWLAMAAPLAAFTDNGDGTVTDPATGLMWDRCSWGQTGNDCSGGSASTHNWQTALGIAVEANTNNHLGYNDWRLPNRTELESLVDINKATGPTIDTVAFPNTPPSGFLPWGAFWSSTLYTVYTPFPAGAWFVDFSRGDSRAISESSDLHVRLVRSGQSFDALAAGTATQMVINAGNNQSAIASTAVATAPSVRVTDANENPVEGVSVTFAVASGDGTIDPTTPVATDASGIATVNSWTLGDTAGTNTLTASAAGLPDVTFSASATTAPAAPTAVIATAGSAQATVSWTAPTDTGGSPITGYTVTGDPGGSCSVAGDITDCTITGLTNGTEYTFSVIATNAQGNSPPSAPSNTVVPSELLFRDRFEGD